MRISYISEMNNAQHNILTMFRGCQFSETLYV